MGYNFTATLQGCPLNVMIPMAQENNGRKGYCDLDKNLVRQIEAIVGKENVLSSIEDLICYGYDATNLEVLPGLVVFPSSAKEISQILILANKNRFPVVPRGMGTGFSGGSLPVWGGVVLVTTRLNRILEVDTENLIAIVEPGVVTGDFQKEVEKLGLFYPPDPASQLYCSLGGNVAECAGGPRAVKYGVTKDYVLGLEVVLPTGEIIETGVKTMKGVVGYDLTKLFVGSEGTLGIDHQDHFKTPPFARREKDGDGPLSRCGGCGHSGFTDHQLKDRPVDPRIDGPCFDPVRRRLSEHGSSEGCGGVAPDRGRWRPGGLAEIHGQN